MKAIALVIGRAGKMCWTKVLQPTGRVVTKMAEGLWNCACFTFHFSNLLNPFISAWAAVQFYQTFMSRVSQGLVSLPFLWSCIAFGSISLIIGAQALQQHVEFLDRRALIYFGLHSSNTFARSIHWLMGAVSVICSIMENAGIFLYSHLDLGLCHAAIFIVGKVLFVGKAGCRLVGRVLRVFRSSLSAILNCIHFVISLVTTSLWSICKAAFSTFESVVRRGWSTLLRAIIGVWTNPIASLLASIGLLIVTYLDYSGHIDISRFVFSAFGVSRGWLHEVILASPAAVKGAIASLATHAANSLQKLFTILPNSAQFKQFYSEAFSQILSSAQNYSNLWQAFISVQSVKQHFQSISEFHCFARKSFFLLTSSSHIVVFAAFAIAASAIHLCVSATVSVWFSAPLQDKRFIFATFGRGAVKLVLLPVVGLSLVSLSISDVYVSIFKFAAAPFAILYALGSLTHFYWAVIDFQSIFSQRISEPRQVAPPQRRHGRRNPVEEEVQPANNMQAIETVEHRARRLLNNLASPKKRFIEQDCPICFETMQLEEDGSSKNSNSASKAIYLPCGHGLHESCCVDVVKLGLIDSQCPMCRTPLFSQDVGRQLFL